MLHHHSAEKYEVLAAKAAANARDKMSELFTTGKEKAMTALQKVQALQPDDYLPKATDLRFGIEEATKRLTLGFGQNGTSKEFKLHPHAQLQLAERAKIPQTYLKTLIDDGQLDLLTKNFRERYDLHGTKKFLVRVADGEARGFLSDRYRRLDSAPLVEAFVNVAMAFGAVPVDARVLDTKFSLRMMLPKIYEPAENEVLAFGLDYKNSDYGDGKVELRGFALRLWCTNYAMCEDGLSQVHLGRQISENFEFSQETYKLDTQAMASASKDIAEVLFAPKYIEAKLDAIRQASENKVDAQALIEVMRKNSKLLKGEADAIAELYTGAEVEKLPPGNTAWRLSNAISLFAQQADPYRALELENIAGDVAGLQQKTKTN